MGEFTYLYSWGFLNPFYFAQNWCTRSYSSYIQTGPFWFSSSRRTYFLSIFSHPLYFYHRSCVNALNCYSSVTLSRTWSRAKSMYKFKKIYFNRNISPKLYASDILVMQISQILSTQTFTYDYATLGMQQHSNPFQNRPFSTAFGLSLSYCLKPLQTNSSATNTQRQSSSRFYLCILLRSNDISQRL